MHGALTTQMIPSEGSYYCKRRKRIIHVPKTHSAIVCQNEDCEFSLQLPNHMISELESSRVRHLQTCHYKQLLIGEMTIHLETAWNDFVHNTTQPVRILAKWDRRDTTRKERIL